MTSTNRYKGDRSSDTSQRILGLHASGLWQVPAFCDGGNVIKHDVVKDRIIALQQHRTTTEQSTEDILKFQEIHLWKERIGTPVILLEGTSQSLKRLERFGVLVVEELEKTSTVLHLLSPLPADAYPKTPATFGGNDVLRQLTIQCLHLVSLDRIKAPNDQELLAYVITRVKSGQIDDWFSVMESILRHSIRPVSIVLNTEILRSRVHDASSWPARFSGLCRRLSDIGSTLRVMIISGRQISKELYDDIRIVGIMRNSVQLKHPATEISSENSLTMLPSAPVLGDSDGFISNRPLISAKGGHIHGQDIPKNRSLDEDTTMRDELDSQDSLKSDSNVVLGHFQGADSGSLYATEHN